MNSKSAAPKKAARSTQVEEVSKTTVRRGRVVPVRRFAGRTQAMTDRDVVDVDESLPANVSVTDTATGLQMTKELAALNAQMDTSLPPIDEVTLKRLGRITLWRILVEPYIPKYSGVIATHKSVDEAERILSKVGRVLQLGSFCYKSKTAAGLDLSLVPEEERATPGKYVLYEMYAGQEIHLTTGHVLRALTETELLMVIDDPTLVRGYL